MGRLSALRCKSLWRKRWWDFPARRHQESMQAVCDLENMCDYYLVANQQPSLDTASIRRRATSGSIQHGMACPICRGPITTNWNSAHGRNEPGSTRSFQSRQTSQSPGVDAQQSIPGHQECLYHFIASTNAYAFGVHLHHCVTRTLKTLL